MNRTSGFKFVLLTLALLCAVSWSVTSWGQAISGDLVGTVVDKSGALIPNVPVTATNDETGVKAATKTGANGDFRFANLLVGHYTLTASAAGFKTTSLKGFPIELNKTSTARLELEVGQISTTIEVIAAQPVIDTTTAQLETTYDAKQLQDLPTAGLGLGVLNLSLLQAGVASSGGLGAGTGPSMSGQRPRNNNFTVEGVDNNDKGVTGPLIYVPNDAVANFTVMSNQFNPEFGHSTGGQFNSVVLSGTNSFHGRAYEHFQNRNLNALDNSSRLSGFTSNPRYDNNRFGGQLGGPIFKNKLFFFVNYEMNPIGQSATGGALQAPTAAGYAALLGIPGVSSANINGIQPYVQAASSSGSSVAVCDYATPSIDSGLAEPCFYSPDSGHLGIPTNIEVGDIPLNAPNYLNQKFLTTSMDYNLSDKDQIRGRYIYNKLAFLDTGNVGQTLPVFFTNVAQPYHLVALSEYHAFTPMINNEFRVGYNRTGYNYGVPSGTFLGLDKFPNIAVDDLSINVGPSPNAPQYSTQNLYQLVDNISWVKGNHTLKFGFEARKYISPQLFIQRSRGDYEWAGLDGYANDTRPDFGERSFGTVGYNGDQYAIYWFANDTWKIRQSLSLNLGVRYEYTGIPFGWTQQSLNSLSNVPGLISFDTPQAPRKGFMPRIGFAWSPGNGGNTSVRGGFGMGYDVLYDNIGTLSRPPQIGSTSDCALGDPVTAECVASNFLANGGLVPTGASGITVLDQETARANTASFLPGNVKYPQSITWNLGVQHVFAHNYTVDVRYVGTRGVHLNVQNRLNVINRVDSTHFLPTYIDTTPTQTELDALTTTLADLQARPGKDPAYTNITCDDGETPCPFRANIVGFVPWGDSIYHGLQTQLNRRFANGLQFQAAYTWSHTIDDATADFFSTIVTPRRQQDFRNLKADRGNSLIDHRHRITLQFIYDLPFFSKDSNWVMKNVVGNWEIAPVFTYQTGQWGTVQSGQDANINGDSAGDRAIFNPNGVPGTGTDVTTLHNTDGDTVAYQAIDPTARYIRARAGALTTTGRGNFLMNPINNWDMTLLKRINLTEQMRFEVGAGFFNVLNHGQFIAGSINQINSIGYTAANEGNYFKPGLPNFNDARATWSSNSRIMQLSVKFIF